MDPYTIATTVASITKTCLVTGKAIYDFTCQYKDAPFTMVAISPEATALILSKPEPEKLLRSRPEIASTSDTSLTGCMVIFSCLDQEIREVSRHLKGREFTWKSKLKTVWKQGTFQQLLDGLRGQQLAINTLVQLLQMDSLQEITALLQQKGPELKQTAARASSLRHEYPAVGATVAESIYSPEERMSVFSIAESARASLSTGLEFDFDDIIVNSVAYRRALAAAKAHTTMSGAKSQLLGDLIDFSDNDTLKAEELGPNLVMLTEGFMGMEVSNEIENPSKDSDAAKTHLPAGDGRQIVPVIQTTSDRNVCSSSDLKPNGSNDIPWTREDESIRVTTTTDIPEIAPNLKCEVAIKRSGIPPADRIYHPRNSTCADCDLVFEAEERYYTCQDRKQYCVMHYITREARMCPNCGLPVLEEEYMSDLAGFWHLNCFKLRAEWQVKMFRLVEIKDRNGVWRDGAGLVLDASTFPRRYKQSMDTISWTLSVVNNFMEQAGRVVRATEKAIAERKTPAAVQLMAIFCSMAEIVLKLLELVPCETMLWAKKWPYRGALRSLQNEWTAAIQSSLTGDGRTNAKTNPSTSMPNLDGLTDALHSLISTGLTDAPIRFTNGLAEADFLVVYSTAVNNLWSCLSTIKISAGYV